MENFIAAEINNFSTEINEKTHEVLSRVWNVLANCLGGDSLAGDHMKEVGTNHWLSPNTGMDI